MKIEISHIVYILIFAVFIIAIIQIRLEMRVKRMLRGNKVDDIESSLQSVLEDIQALNLSKKSTGREISELKKELQLKTKTAKTVRFNPFNDVGGKQSFATALLDNEGNGIVISSLYSREKVSTFGKPIIKYNSEYELTDEEKKAIELVKNG